MRAAHADDTLIDVGAGYALGLLVGGFYHLGCRAQLGDQPLAHPGRFHDGVAAIAQGTLVEVSGQHAR